MIAMMATDPAQPCVHVRRNSVSSGESQWGVACGDARAVERLVLACAVHPAAAMLRLVAYRVVRPAVTIVTGVYV